MPSSLQIIMIILLMLFILHYYFRFNVSYNNSSNSNSKSDINTNIHDIRIKYSNNHDMTNYWNNNNSNDIDNSTNHKVNDNSIDNNSNNIYDILDSYYEKYCNQLIDALEGPYMDEFNRIREITKGSEKGIYNIPYGYYVDNNSLPRLTTMNKYMIQKIQSLPQLVDEDSQIDSTNITFIPDHDTLIVFTTCNHIAMTIRALKHLKFSLRASDLMIVDDHSIDGTVEYLVKKGYFVVGKSRALGLTNSWNSGYELAVRLKYKYVFFINNDVLVPAKAIDYMRRELLHEALIVPMTTRKGAGHNPIQSLIDILGLDKKMSDYINDPSIVEHIQSSISNLFSRNLSLPRLVPSLFKGYPRFNGFLFGVNITGIREAAYDHPRLLFDDKLIMVDQEGDLVNRMVQLNTPTPKVALTAFIYHFKSVTVKKSGYIVGKPSFDKAGKQIDQSERDDLQHYHPEFVNSTVESNDKILNKLYKSLREASSSTFLSLSRSYPKYPERLSESCKHNEEDCMKRKNSSSPALIEIAFATSNSQSDPLAGDIFTAYELGTALQKEFSNVNVRYLRKNVDWYDAQRLVDVDIIVVLLDNYDLSKALFSKEAYMSQLREGKLRTDGLTEIVSIKDSIFCIAWVRNWFHRWLSRPWIGNYDLILTSSAVSKSFYENFGETIGFQVRCVMSCPNIKIPKLTEHANKSHKVNTYYRSLLPRRVKVPIGLLRIATNPDRFSINHEPIDKFVADYAFTGSYYNYSRKIMDFDPSLISKWKGIVIGSGWDSAPVANNWKEMYAGSVPYDSIPRVYRSVKIVIDDSNHVTAPFGSVNSRVYDALASGALVITNGVIGMKETFENHIPTYNNAEDLTKQIDKYLTDRKERKQLVKNIREEIIANHTYLSRARELSQILVDHGFDFLPKLSYLTDDNPTMLSSFDTITVGIRNNPDPITTICIGIRTHQLHEHWIEILLRGLSSQYLISPFSRRVSLNIYIIDTDERKKDNIDNNKKEFKTLLMDIIDKIHNEYGKQFIYLLWNSEQEPREYENAFYGYDSTDYLLTYMLLRPQCLSGWIMFTNGDNMYNSMWFDSVASHIVHDSVDLVAWDFVTHHERSVDHTRLRQQVIKVAIERKFIDLGSVLVRTKLYIEADVRFLDNTIFTTDLFARDFNMILSLAQIARKNGIRLIHRTLLFHQ